LPGANSIEFVSGVETNNRLPTRTTSTATNEKRGSEMLNQQTQGLAKPAADAMGMHAMSGGKYVAWIAQIAVAVILAQTLYFKFTYAPETQVIFASRGGRPAATLVGVMELICVILLVVPRTAAIGAGLSLVVISGAIMTHLTSLGIQVVDPATGESDGGLLFGLALAVAIGSLIVIAIRWREFPFVSRSIDRT
jgi:uncharacterized membrane protein YphA (DoxX/SURF4 family)